MVSSSCSYAAAALAKSLFARGADFTASMVFMFASTNLVVELGIVLWLLLGWQFALAELVGGAIMIVLLALVLPRVFLRGDVENARAGLNNREADGMPTTASRPRTSTAPSRPGRWRSESAAAPAGQTPPATPSAT
jgi:uncharacterized membrane protein YraQ (UPF0718 family)